MSLMTPLEDEWQMDPATGGFQGERHRTRGHFTDIDPVELREAYDDAGLGGATHLGFVKFGPVQGLMYETLTITCQ